jgi:parallel beta-helix repeat protein
MLSRAIAVAAFIVAGSMALAVSPAAAHSTTTVQCGQKLTESVKLANNLLNCRGDGLVIGADGITVDLNGHTVDGIVTQTDCPQGPPEPGAGINIGAYDGVTITDGAVQQFNNGIAAGGDTDGMSDSRVHHLTVRDNRFGGISLGSGGGAAATANNRIDHNFVSGTSCGAGIELNTGQANRFTDNRVKDSGGIVVCCGEASDGNVVARNWVSGGQGFGAILVFFSGNSRVVENRVSDVGEGGIVIVGGSSNALVKDNAIVRAHGAGIAVESFGDESSVPTDVHIIDNTFTKVADGMLLFETDRPVLRNNSVTGAGTFGDPEAFGVGIVLDGVSDAVVQRNAVAGSKGPGIVIGVPPKFNPSARPVADNVVADNTVSGEGADGISVDVIAENTRLERNDASRNAGDGIHVMSATTTLTRNTANRNGNYGIEAVPPAIDGGGNHARGNGNPAQCIGITCS